MSKGLRSQSGKIFMLYCKLMGPPLILNQFAFNQAMYTGVAQHFLLHWYNNEGINKRHDMKCYFTDTAPFARFTPAITIASPPTKKRESIISTYPSRKTPKKNMIWSPDLKKITVEAHGC